MPPCWSTVSAPMPTDLSACSTSRPCWHSGAGCRVTANGTADRRLVDALGRRFQPPRRSADGGAETIVGGARGVLDRVARSAAVATWTSVLLAGLGAAA